MRRLFYCQGKRAAQILTDSAFLRRYISEGGETVDNAKAEYLVQTYADMILRIGFTWLKDMDDAKDICQMALIRLLGDGHTFESPEQERAWVIRVTINLCKDWRKSAWFRHRAGLDDAVHLTVDAPEPANDSLLQAVNMLPLKYRQVIYLLYYEEYTVSEIAAMLGQSPALVSTHLARARKKLKTMLGDDDFA